MAGWIGLALVVPALIDGWLQMKYDIESNNLRRLATGLMAGHGSILWTSWKVGFVLSYFA